VDTQPQPVAMASADIDSDGIADLVVGYNTGIIAVHRGNLDAFAPQSEASFQAIGRGEFPSPFLLDAQTFAVPVSPDFIALGNFFGSGNQDLAIASLGGSAIYLLAGDGRGNFASPLSLNIAGGVAALAGGNLGTSEQFTKLLVSAGSGKSSSLLVFSGSAEGFKQLAGYALGAPASNILFGSFGDPGQDAAFLSAGHIFILRASSMQLSKISLPVSASALALGSFVYDRNGGSQLALLGSDGSIQIAVRNEFDPRAYTVEEFQAIRQAKLLNQPLPSFARTQPFPINGWKIVESFPAVGAVSSSQAPVFFRTRVSSNGADDIMWLGAGNGRMVVIAHADARPGASSFVPGEVSVKAYNGSPVSALPMRTNLDGRPGVMALHQGEIAPSMLMPLPDPTFFPNRFDDIAPRGVATTCQNHAAADGSGDCTLREAILAANDASNPGTDTIMLQAGTYQLTRAKVVNDFSGNNGALYVNDSINIVGAGQNSTIIQAGTNNTNGVDMVMAVNEDINPITNATASISNLTLKFGHNNGAHGNDGDGGCMEFDTGSSGNANLTLTNVTLTDCSTTKGNGAGIAIFNFIAANNGLVTFSGSIVQNNSAVDSTTNVGAGGGGIWVSQDARMSMTNSQVLNNNATQVNGTGKGIGGGIFTFTNTANSRQTVIHNSTISGNKSAGFGGGIWNSVNLLVDQGTVISGNTAGTDGTNPVATQSGGGLYDNTSSNGCPGACTDVATLNKVTIINNTATGSGGGIYHGNNTGGGSLTMNFSRLAGNTATTSGSNFFEDHSVATITNNWWGTNAVATTITNSSGTPTFDPFIVLTHNATPAIIRINQSTTLTGDMSKDNHGIGAALTGNLNQIVGLPITFDNAVLGTIPQAQPETLGNPVPTATATFNAGGTSGRGSARATVDQALVGANSNLIASATEAATTVTITTVGAHNFATNETVVISGVGVSSYNGTFRITATPTTTTFNYTTTAGLGASSGGTANVGIIILEPPSITKSFSPTTVAINAPSTITFSITNPNVITINGSFVDNLPTNLVVATPPNVVNNCGGSVTAAAGATHIDYSNTNSQPIGTCTIQVNVQSAVDGVYHNTVQILSTDAGDGNTAATSPDLTVINPPHIVKAFGAATIPLNGTTSLTFTIDSNGNQNLTLTGVAFTDNLPAGLVAATPSSVATNCSGGTATAADGSSTVSLSGASLPPNSSCTVSLNVQGTTAGVKNNSVQVTSTNGGTGNTSNASITVVAPPVIIKFFGAGSIPLNGSTSLSFTIQNNNATVGLTGVGFNDTLPAGLIISTPNGLSGSCGGGTITATQNTNVVSLSGASIAASSSCTFSVNVTGTAAGQQNNTTGNVTSTEGGTGGTASASIKVEAPPSIAKVFNPSTIALNATTSLTFTITNPAANVDDLTGVAFSDTLPTGLTVANASATVCGGTLTTTAPTGIALTGATIAVNSQCQFSVTVTGAASGQYTNTTGAVTSTNGGTGNTASANLTVAQPPSITKSFGAASIPLNGTTTLSFNITNPNTNVALNGLAFTDNLPAGLVVASTPNLSNACGGTATAVGGSGSVSLSGGTLAASASCTVSVNVQGTTAGVKNNSVQVTSTEGGTGNTSNASITVVAPPVIIKFFGAASIPVGGSTSLTFTIQNNNPGTALNGVAFSDTLPAGLVVATPNGLSNACGGSVTATAGSGSISLSGGSLAATASCNISLNVTGTAAGQQNNTTGNVTSTEGGTGGTASASLNVEGPPSIAKVFNPSTISLNATTSLTFTITNPAANPNALTGVAFSDTLPTGLTVANASATVCGGTLTLTAPTGIALTGATINTNSQCIFSITVTGAVAGQYTNTTGNVTSTNGGTGNTASANLTVGTPPSITKAFGAASILVGASTSLTFNINNPNTTLALNGLAFTDNLPAGLVVATPNGLSNACGGAVTATAGSGTISLSGGTLAASASCNISLNVTGAQAGVQNNTTGPISSTESGAGATSNTASITVIGPPSIAKAFGAASINLNATTTLTFTITNPNATVALTGVAFGDTLPGGLVVATPNGLTGSCGAGTITTGTVSGFSVVNLSGGTIAAGGSCTFAVNVVGQTGGHKVNTTGTVTSANAGNGNQATASIDVQAPDVTITKTHSGNFSRGQTGATYTITVSNVGFGPTVGTVTVTDTLPNVQNTLVPTALAGTGWTCNLGTLTCTRSDALAAGASYPAITLTVDVPINIQANFTNTATVSGGGDVNPSNNTATDPTHTGPPLSITASGTDLTVSAGFTGNMNFQVDSSNGVGTVTFACSGLPAGASCSFNPPSTNQITSTVTMSVATVGVASLTPPTANHWPGPVYALLFPLLGMVGLGAGSRKTRKARLRMAMVFGVLLVLLALSACGGHYVSGTPKGAFPITVTATGTNAQATATVNLTVQ
jgi:uncharacterized repeat protein (TIGR01451 family)